AARGAWKRVTETVEVLDRQPVPMKLPAPVRSLKIEGITVAAPGNGRVLLSDVTFEATAGQVIGIIGPSGGGKSTLARALTGVWPTLRGSVRLDDAELSQWSDADRGASVGYLPQDVALLDASVEENIARLDPNASPNLVVEASRAAAVHEMIVRLPEGYRTHLGPMGTALSGGQRQRLGLARALYGNPFIVVLDEPNANLDPEGEAALTAAIESVKARGGIVVVIAHRPSVLQSCDLIGVVQRGKLTNFGPRDQVMNPRPVAAASAPAPVTATTATPRRKPNASRRLKEASVAGGKGGNAS
ncbi:MAG: ATP-binding cassette domain-containing protein, partial [Paracoccaceae bacterium]